MKPKPGIETTATHTPTPWTLMLKDGGRWQIPEPLICGGPSFDGSGRKEAYPDGIIVSETRAQANAALIVHAVNTHADLLAACERALPWIGKLLAEGLHNRCASPISAENTAELLRAAIAKARGQA